MSWELFGGVPNLPRLFQNWLRDLTQYQTRILVGKEKKNKRSSYARRGYKERISRRSCRLVFCRSDSASRHGLQLYLSSRNVMPSWRSDERRWLQLMQMSSLAMFLLLLGLRAASVCIFWEEMGDSGSVAWSHKRVVISCTQFEFKFKNSNFLTNKVYIQYNCNPNLL